MIQRGVMKDRVVVITGASAGIGATLAEDAARKGAKVVLVARREKELREVAARCGADAHVVVADVTKRADFGRIVASAIERFGRIDVLVNNAGRGITCMPSALTDEDVDEMMLVNFKSVLYGMQAVLPHFVARGSGHVINVSSMLGRVPFTPVRSAYSAAKAALDSLSASFRIELRAQHPNIHVTVVHPPVVATDFGLHALHGGPDSRKLPGAQDVGEVAEVIAGAIENPRADVYTRPRAQQIVVDYYAAEDMAAAEQPFVMPPR